MRSSTALDACASADPTPLRPQPSAFDVDWVAEWDLAWKPHVDNAWFRHQDDVYTAWWRERRPEPRSTGLDIVEPLRMLQTDAFNEACRLPSLDGIVAAMRRTVIDISLPILRDAVQDARGRDVRLLPCSTDVRRLGIRGETFDVVFSPSTLDHFGRTDQIPLALSELRRVLRPGGRLLITLDNPWNPLLRVRNRLYRRRGRVSGLIPFAMGCTLSRERLVDALGAAGFEVLDSRYALHTPRVIGLWLGEWAARAGHAGAGARLRTLFNGLERMLRRLPTAPWTGCFVAVDCVRRG
jgi:SAM-dependent methyltransferase